MSCNIELSEEETLCLHRYFERVDDTQDLSFVHPAEYMAFQRIAGQVCKTGAAMLQASCNRLLENARESASRGTEWPSASSGVAASACRSSVAATGPTFNAMEASPTSEATPDAFEETRIRILLCELRAAFEHGDLADAKALCAHDAQVVSPSHGAEPASAFLTRTFASRGPARLRLHEVRTNIEGRPQALGHLSYDESRAGGFEARDDVEVLDVAINIDAQRTRVRSMIVLSRPRAERSAVRRTTAAMR